MCRLVRDNRKHSAVLLLAPFSYLRGRMHSRSRGCGGFGYGCGGWVAMLLLLAAFFVAIVYNLSLGS